MTKPKQRAVLYAGTPSGTSRHRAEALMREGHPVEHLAAGPPTDFWRVQAYRVGLKLRYPPDLLGINRRLREAASQRRFDVIWVDKGVSVKPTTLRRVRASCPSAKLVSYSPDDMFNPVNGSRQYHACIPHYDLHVTTKSYNVAELEQAGARGVLFVDNAFDPVSHRPVPLADEERPRFETDIGFIGLYEPQRADMMWRLARAGLRVTINGARWQRFPKSHPNLERPNRFLVGDDYAKAIGGARINLGFLRKANRDLQTTRTMEIPACGGFLLAERTDEHLRLFEEGREAEFFDSFEELEEKCRYYLEHEQERRAIAEAGHRRCMTSGYSNDDVVRRILERLDAG